MRKWTLFIVLLFVLVGLVACGGEDRVGEVNQILEETLEIESDFEKEGNTLYDLEEKDAALYEQVIAENDPTELNKLIDEARQILEERNTHLEKAKNILTKSEEHFSEMEPYIEKIGEKELQTSISKLYDVMDQRYQLYGEVYNAYITSLDDTNEFYTLLGEGDIDEDIVYTQLETVNHSYEKVNSVYQEFNQATEKFNKQKRAYLSLFDE